jgi:hypothetical protein
MNNKEKYWLVKQAEDEGTDLDWDLYNRMQDVGFAQAAQEVMPPSNPPAVGKHQQNTLLKSLEGMRKSYQIRDQRDEEADFLGPVKSKALSQVGEAIFPQRPLGTAHQGDRNQYSKKQTEVARLGYQPPKEQMVQHPHMPGFLITPSEHPQYFPGVKQWSKELPEGYGDSLRSYYNKQQGASFPDRLGARHAPSRLLSKIFPTNSVDTSTYPTYAEAPWNESEALGHEQYFPQFIPASNKFHRNTISGFPIVDKTSLPTFAHEHHHSKTTSPNMEQLFARQYQNQNRPSNPQYENWRKNLVLNSVDNNLSEMDAQVLEQLTAAKLGFKTPGKVSLSQQNTLKAIQRLANPDGKVSQNWGEDPKEFYDDTTRWSNDLYDTSTNLGRKYAEWKRQSFPGITFGHSNAAGNTFPTASAYDEDFNNMAGAVYSIDALHWKDPRTRFNDLLKARRKK